MEQQDLEVAIKVLEERQNIQGNHLKDVDECCGKLKGSTAAEYRALSEKILKLEGHMDDNCQGVEVELAAFEERIKTQFKTIQELKEEILEIRKTYKKVTLEIIIGVLLLIAALFIHL
ncbi:MAG: hypothetical protein BZ138_07840 [Methanosphaera sp. rholeuAM270]|nr:MAG: hypothetical protein BZ138_07840 [Methanosphaera sp. rholeuAM270]